MILKKCSKCKNQKDINDFFNSKRSKDGKTSWCKMCHAADGKTREHKYRELKRSYYHKDPVGQNKKSAERYQKNLEKNRAKRREWRLNNPEYSKEYHKRWYEKNREHKLNKNRQNEIKSLNDPSSTLRIKKALRIRLSQCLRKNKTPKLHRTFELLGCTMEQFKIHLKRKFKEDMCWANYGKVWHIDHEIPCSKYDLTKDEEILMCFHYSNLQPMYASENQKKYNKINYVCSIP